MRRYARLLIGLAFGVVPIMAALLGSVGVAAADGSCTAVDGLGMSAEVIATTGQDVTGTIDATGCDIGVYVGQGVVGVTVEHATITGANVHGIFVQDTWGVFIHHNTVMNNVPEDLYEETKAITVTGSNHVVVMLNTVTGNGGGGIAITDDGPNNPAGPNPGQSRPGDNNIVAQNTVSNNSNGCGIVVAADNPGEGVHGNRIYGNIVTGNPVGIVVAANPPDTEAINNRITNNDILVNVGPGVIVHSNSAGDNVTGTMVIGNRVSGNAGIGIMVAGEDPNASLTNTVVSFNRISNEPQPIVNYGDTNTKIVANNIS